MGVGFEDGTASCQVVSSGASGGGNDEAITNCTRNLVAVDVDVELHGVWTGAAVDYHLVHHVNVFQQEWLRDLQLVALKEKRLLGCTRPWVHL